MAIVWKVVSAEKAKRNQINVVSLASLGIFLGGAENDGREHDGPSKLQGMKLQDMKVQVHEIARHNKYLFIVFSIPIPVVLAVLWKLWCNIYS